MILEVKIDRGVYLHCEHDAIPVGIVDSETGVLALGECRFILDRNDLLQLIRAAVEVIAQDDRNSNGDAVIRVTADVEIEPDEP